MRHVNIVRIIITIMSFTFVACEKTSETPDQAQPSSTSSAPATNSGHAPQGARPGSHEDWCGEHQVPESNVVAAILP